MVALERRRDGLPALVLAWGAVDDAGYVAEVLQVRCSADKALPRMVPKADMTAGKLVSQS